MTDTLTLSGGPRQGCGQREEHEEQREARGHTHGHPAPRGPSNGERQRRTTATGTPPACMQLQAHISEAPPQSPHERPLPLQASWRWRHGEGRLCRLEWDGGPHPLHCGPECL